MKKKIKHPEACIMSYSAKKLNNDNAPIFKSNTSRSEYVIMH